MFERGNEILAQDNLNINDLACSSKLMALWELLLECGIGGSPSTSESSISSTDKEFLLDCVSPHRALIFCQMKSMVDLIENLLLRPNMPSVSFLRLDGSVEASRRHEIVLNFNQDPSIDCLLLTTNIGGLGLNLTGADTVIFVEHDWNPMKDLQAMDRAHRLGLLLSQLIFRYF